MYGSSDICVIADLNLKTKVDEEIRAFRGFEERERFADTKN
jgi:hypothetical protein